MSTVFKLEHRHFPSDTGMIGWLINDKRERERIKCFSLAFMLNIIYIPKLHHDREL